MLCPCPSVSRRYQYCISGAMNNILSNGNHKNNNNTTAPWVRHGMYIRYVILNRTHTNDNNITLSSSCLSVVAVTVAVALPWVRRVYSTFSGTTNNHSLSLSVLHAGQVQRVMYTNDNNTSTPSSLRSQYCMFSPVKLNRQVPCPVMPIVVVVLIILFILFSTYRIAFDVRFRIRCCCIDYSIIISLVGVIFIIIIIIAFRLFTLSNRV